MKYKIFSIKDNIFDIEDVINNNKNYNYKEYEKDKENIINKFYLILDKHSKSVSNLCKTLDKLSLRIKTN